MATLLVRFFDDLRGTTPKITTFPTHASSTKTPDTRTSSIKKSLADVTVSKVTKGIILILALVNYHSSIIYFPKGFLKEFPKDF